MKGILKLSLPAVLTMYWLWVSQWVIICLRSDNKQEIKQLTALKHTGKQLTICIEDV